MKQQSSQQTINNKKSKQTVYFIQSGSIEK